MRQHSKKHRRHLKLSDEFGARLVLDVEMDDDAFRALTDPYCRELQLHCYRILGSVQDAEEMLQETLLAAWRGIDGYEERASLRAWLYRIATNRCLNALRDSRRRPAPPAPSHFPKPTRRGETLWLDPYPDQLLEGIAETAPGPAERYELKEAVTLAFVTALQQLPPRQRAVLVLRDVLGFRAAEVAALLESSEAAVNSALQRARAGLEASDAVDRGRASLPSSAAGRDLVSRFAEAVERGDVEGMVALLTDDALLTMPPLPLEYEGREAIAAFLGRAEEARGAPLRVLATATNAQPALASYLPDPGAGIARFRGLMVLTLAGDAIAAITWFEGTGALHSAGLPETLPVAGQ